MSFVDKYEMIEGYINGTLSTEDKALFEEKIQNNPSLQKEVEQHRFFLDSLKVYKKRKTLKEQMNALHEELAYTPILQKTKHIHWNNLWHKYFSTVAVAASVALITVVGILWNLKNYNSLENKQIGFYQSLKKDLDKVKATQKGLVEENAKAQKMETLPTRPVNSTATAFVINANGYLITNYHVVKDARSMFIETKHTPQQYLQVEVFYKDELRDLALLKVADSSFVGFANLPYSFRTETADLGEDVFTLAYPRNDMVYGEGTISSQTGFEGDSTAYQISIPVNPGNSGSPLFDEKGNLIGIITGKSTREEGAAYAVKAAYIQALIDSLNQNDTERNIQLPRYNQIQYLKRTKQIHQLKNTVFELKVYTKTFNK